MNGEWLWRVARQEAAFIILPLIYFTTELIKKTGSRIRDEGDARDEKVILEKSASNKESLFPFFLSFFLFSREIDVRFARSPFAPPLDRAQLHMPLLESMAGELCEIFFFYPNHLSRLFLFLSFFFIFSITSLID